MYERTRDLQQGYNRVAGEYATRISGELAGKPADRAFLDRFTEAAGPLGWVCDLGCGPAHVGRYLQGRGLAVVGLDLSHAMLAEARRLNPGMALCDGTMLALPFRDASLGGIAAFYSVIHVPRPELARAFSEMQRVLQPGGALALAFHLGDADLHTEEWWGHQASIDFYFFTRAEFERRLTAEGFDITESFERPPYPEVEHQSQRAYIRATRRA